MWCDDDQMSVLKAKSELDASYAKSIRKLVTRKTDFGVSEPVSSPLHLPLSSLSDYFEVVATSFESLQDQTNEYVIRQLNELTEKLNRIHREQREEGTKLVKAQKQSLDQFQTAEAAYEKLCKTCESSAAELAAVQDKCKKGVSAHAHSHSSPAAPID